MLQTTPFGFDVSVWEFFCRCSPARGSWSCRPDGDGPRVPAALDRLSERVSAMHFVPSMLQAFLDEPRVPRAARSLRRVLVQRRGAAARRWCERFFAAPAERRLHNLYGPTEAAVDVTAGACRAAATGRVVPIGRPIANTRIYVLDAHWQPGAGRRAGRAVHRRRAAWRAAT